MGRKSLRLIFGLLLAASLTLVGVQPAAAQATLVVDDDGMATPGDCNAAMPTYPTINAAVADADPGDTILVCPGGYNESVTITFPLTLLGPNAGISWDGARGPEAAVSSLATTFNVTDGEDVTIDGFTITGDFGIYVSGSTTNTSIENNIVTGITRALTLDSPGSNADVLDNHLISNVRSFHVSGGPYTNMEVNGNRFSGLATTGIFFFGGLSNSITGFEFNDNLVEHLANMASTITNGTVSENTFDLVLAGTLSLQINLHNSTVTENTFEGDDANACLQLFGSQFGLIPSEDVLISDNTFNDCGTPTPPANYAIQLSPDIQNINITENQISNGFEGVNTRDATLWDVTGLDIHINFNNITDNTSFGVRNGQMGVLDAECNWWGSPDGPGPVGPGSGDNVSLNVDYDPWLVAPAPEGACAGGVIEPPNKVTGGGKIDSSEDADSLDLVLELAAVLINNGSGPASVGGEATFGLSVACCPAKGNLTYNDHDADVTIKATSVESLVVSEPSAACLTGKHAEFTGDAKQNGADVTYTVDVDDCGKPGSGSTPDRFMIQTSGGYMAEGPLIGGNITIHD